jgi:SAM-dependent methyltransferase
MSYGDRYWDEVAKQEVDKPARAPERYTQEQCLAAVRRGYTYLKRWGEIRVLKTDLWTEGIVRSREVLEAARLEIEKRHQVHRRGDVVAYGMDISRHTCRQAFQVGGWSTVAQADIRHLPVQEESVDMILDISTIDHVPLMEAKPVIRDYWRCLPPGGVLILMFSHDDGVMRKAGFDGAYFFPIEDIRRQLRYGYAIREEYAIHFLNILPLSYLMCVADRIKMPWLVSAPFGRMEYSRLSKRLRKWAPMYVIIATKLPRYRE